MLFLESSVASVSNFRKGISFQQFFSLLPSNEPRRELCTLLAHRQCYLSTLGDCLLEETKPWHSSPSECNKKRNGRHTWEIKALDRFSRQWKGSSMKNKTSCPATRRIDVRICRAIWVWLEIKRHLAQHPLQELEAVAQDGRIFLPSVGLAFPPFNVYPIIVGSTLNLNRATP